MSYLRVKIYLRSRREHIVLGETHEDYIWYIDTEPLTHSIIYEELSAHVLSKNGMPSFNLNKWGYIQDEDDDIKADRVWSIVPKELCILLEGLALAGHFKHIIESSRSLLATIIKSIVVGKMKDIYEYSGSPIGFKILQELKGKEEVEIALLYSSYHYLLKALRVNSTVKSYVERGGLYLFTRLLQGYSILRKMRLDKDLLKKLVYETVENPINILNALFSEELANLLNSIDCVFLLASLNYIMQEKTINLKKRALRALLSKLNAPAIISINIMSDAYPSYAHLYYMPFEVLSFYGFYPSYLNTKCPFVLWMKVPVSLSMSRRESAIRHILRRHELNRGLLTPNDSTRLLLWLFNELKIAACKGALYYINKHESPSALVANELVPSLVNFVKLARSVYKSDNIEVIKYNSSLCVLNRREYALFEDMLKEALHLLRDFRKYELKSVLFQTSRELIKDKILSDLLLNSVISPYINELRGLLL